MKIDLPILRLGIAGFTEAQQQQIVAVVEGAGTRHAAWRLGLFPDADAWWLHGSHTQVLANGILRISPATLSGRAVQLAIADVDRPAAFSLPVAARHFAPAFAFDLADAAASTRLLHQFSAWLQPMLAQYCLAASISREQPALGSGSWEVLRGAELIGVVDLQLGTAVAPDACRADFEDATWCIRDPGDVQLPEHFARASMSQLMWQYALRTPRDLLPPHYRGRPLFFRRPPRLPQRQLKDAHLLLMRELVARPGLRFAQLQQATGLTETPLARHLAALYMVGSITANPRRASVPALRHAETAESGSDASLMPSMLDSGSGSAETQRRPASDLTAPAPLLPDF